MLTSNELIAYLRISLPTLYNWLREDKNFPNVLKGSQHFFDLNKVLRYLEEKYES